MKAAALEKPELQVREETVIVLVAYFEHTCEGLLAFVCELAKIFLLCQRIKTGILVLGVFLTSLSL